MAETELEISFMPDGTGMGFYEALKDGLDAAVASKWMAEFKPELVRKATQATPTV